jgi:hypothetical protein
MTMLCSKKFMSESFILVSLVVLCSYRAVVYSADPPSSSQNWLGTYVGAAIPGHEIVESTPYTAFYYGPASALELRQLQDDAVKGCKKFGGIVLVNSQLLDSLGPVPIKEQSGMTEVVSQGIMAHADGDCVRSVSKK